MLTINGSFLCRNLTGIERFAIELCKQLDAISKPDEFEILVPKNSKIVPDFHNINVVISEKNCSSFPVWDHITMALYCKKNGTNGRKKRQSSDV